jgi:hypothetical protein
MNIARSLVHPICWAARYRFESVDQFQAVLPVHYH